MYIVHVHVQQIPFLFVHITQNLTNFVSWATLTLRLPDDNWRGKRALNLVLLGPTWDGMCSEVGIQRIRVYRYRIIK